MTTLSIKRKPQGIYQKPQEAPQTNKTTSAHKVQATSQKAPQPTTGTRSKAVKARARKMARLCSHWPDLFSMDNPKPLKIGILEDLQKDIADKSLSFGLGSLKAAMAAYTHRFLYQKALSTGGQRFDLTGQPCGEVTPEQQQAATVLVEKARDKGNAHDKGQ